MMGDFNAKTGNESDTNTPDKSNELFDVNFTTPPPASSVRQRFLLRAGAIFCACNEKVSEMKLSCNFSNFRVTLKVLILILHI